jgi:hypothetical protein
VFFVTLGQLAQRGNSSGLQTITYREVGRAQSLLSGHRTNVTKAQAMF